jgi:hypothetical protein
MKMNPARVLNQQRLRLLPSANARRSASDSLEPLRSAKALSNSGGGWGPGRCEDLVGPREL